SSRCRPHPCSTMQSVPTAPSLRRSHFGRDFDLRLQVLAKFPQHTLTQKIGIEFARFCKLDNSFGDSFIDEIALVIKLKSYASHFECGAHDPLGLEIESGTVQKLRDGHDLPHRPAKIASAGTMPGLSLPKTLSIDSQSPTNQNMIAE